MRTGVKWSICILALVILGACLWFAIGKADNRVLGRWIYVAGPPDPTGTNSMGERGIEFLRGSRFVTFGYKMNGRTVDSYGTYSFTSSNRIEMKTIGFRTAIDGTNTDVNLAGKFPAELNRPLNLVFSPERQELSEAEYITSPARACT